jgi:26S proteasome regulatory subunit N3
VSALKLSKSASIAEIEAYIHLLVLLWLIGEHRDAEAHECLQSLVARVEAHNRRSMDALAAKAYYYYALLADEKTVAARDDKLT